MKKIQIHILRIEKWKLDWENEWKLTKKINEESEKLEQSNNDIPKKYTFIKMS